MSKIKVGTKEYTLAQLEKALLQAEKHDTTGSSQTAQTLHGNNAGGYNGLFSSPGVRPDMWTTAPRTDSLFANIPLMPSEYTNEILDIMTGVTASSGTNATGFCGDAPTAGYLKTCQQKYTFGNFRIKTRTIDLTNVGSLVNRADTPKNLLNSGRVDNRLVPSVLADMPIDTRSQIATEMYAV